MPFGDKYKPEKNFNPGPGHYDPDESQTRGNSPSVAMRPSQRGSYNGSSRPLPMNVSDTPVPYDPPIAFGKDSKGFTIGLKRESKIERSPGPGDFETDVNSNIQGGPYISEKDDYFEKNFSVNQSFTTKTPQKSMDYGKSFGRKKSAAISPNKKVGIDT